MIKTGATPERAEFEPLQYDCEMRREVGYQSPEVRGMGRLHDLMLEAVHKLPELEVAEVGTWAGQNAIEMYDRLGRTVNCIDTWAGTPSDLTGVIGRVLGSENVYDVFLKNCGDRISTSGTSIVPWRMTSRQGAAKFHGREKLSAVFIDADHEYEAVREDIVLWWPLVANGGLLAGHDYNEKSFPGVVEAVNEWVGHDIRRPNANPHKNLRAGVLEYGVTETVWYVWKSLYVNDGRTT